ncbi:MAG: hypothetical protein ACJ8IQ_11965 [Chthoniobacterales bacterium]
MHDETAIDALDRRQQLAAAMRNKERDIRGGPLTTHGSDRRHGQDQVADPLELNEKDVHQNLLLLLMILLLIAAED